MQTSCDTIGVKSAWEELRFWLGELLGTSADGDATAEASIWENAALEIGSKLQLAEMRLAVLKQAQAASNDEHNTLKLSPALAIYAATAVGYLLEQVLAVIAKVVERDARSEANVTDLLSALQETEAIWDFAEVCINFLTQKLMAQNLPKGTRIRQVIEREVASLSRRTSISRGGPLRKESIRRNYNSSATSTASSQDSVSTAPTSPRTVKSRRSNGSNHTPRASIQSSVQAKKPQPDGSASVSSFLCYFMKRGPCRRSRARAFVRTGGSFFFAFSQSDGDGSVEDFDQLMHSGHT